MKINKGIIMALLPLVVGLIIGYIMSPKSDSEYEKVLKANEKALQKQIDSLKIVGENNRLKLKSALEEVELKKDTLKLQAEKTAYWKKKYTVASKTPPKQHTEKEIKEVLDSIYAAVPDTGKTHAVSINRLNHIVRDLNVKTVSEELVKQQAKELMIAKNLQKETDEALELSQKQTKIAEAERDSWKDKHDNKQKQLDESDKKSRRYKRERNAAVITTVAVVLIVIL